MIRNLAQPTHPRQRIPRESGDDPYDQVIGTLDMQYSPRERG